MPTIDGDVKYTVPEGTQTGTVFRLKEKGIPYIRGKGRGDEFVTAKIVTPMHLTEAQKEILRAFARATGTDVPTAQNAENAAPKKKRKGKI